MHKGVSWVFNVVLAPFANTSSLKTCDVFKDEYTWSTQDFVMAFWWSRIEAETMIEAVEKHGADYVLSEGKILPPHIDKARLREFAMLICDHKSHL